MFLDGLELILSSNTSLEIVDTACDGFQALSAIEKQMPDVVLTDLNMPEMDGLELVRRIKAKYPEIKILVLSMLKDKETVGSIMEVEAEGFILKNANKADLMKAIQAVYAGDTYYSNEIMNIMLTKYQKRAQHETARNNLTTRELEILQLIAQELTSDKIADKLFISPRTVETHRKNILAKTQSATLIGLLKYAVRNELVAFS
jgi:DNA-binding NarL/FixJ family response regulator